MLVNLHYLIVVYILPICCAGEKYVYINNSDLDLFVSCFFIGTAGLLYKGIIIPLTIVYLFVCRLLFGRKVRIRIPKMLYAAALAFGNEVLAKLIHFS